MTPEQMSEYIELQHQLITILWDSHGRTMEALAAMQRIEQFENELDCNKDIES